MELSNTVESKSNLNNIRRKTFMMSDNITISSI